MVMEGANHYLKDDWQVGLIPQPPGTPARSYARTTVGITVNDGEQT